MMVWFFYLIRAILKAKGHFPLNSTFHFSNIPSFRSRMQQDSRLN